jgi:hypothetical protein
MVPQHTTLAEGRWQKMTLMQQLGNIGSEVSRAANWQGKNNDSYELSFVRSLELLDLTISDPRFRNRLKELTRLREVICDAYFGSELYDTTFKDLNEYFMQFAIASRF